jgi:hypothetical protein
VTAGEGKQDFLWFLGAAGREQDRDTGRVQQGRDGGCIVVSGDIDFDAPDEIRYVYNARLSYVFA